MNKVADYRLKPLDVVVIVAVMLAICLWGVLFVGPMLWSSIALNFSESTRAYGYLTQAATSGITVLGILAVWRRPLGASYRPEMVAVGTLAWVSFVLAGVDLCTRTHFLHSVF